jgi:hypothetical protein
MLLEPGLLAEVKNEPPRRNNPWLHEAKLMSFFYQR